MDAVGGGKPGAEEDEREARLQDQDSDAVSGRVVATEAGRLDDSSSIGEANILTGQVMYKAVAAFGCTGIGQRVHGVQTFFVSRHCMAMHLRTHMPCEDILPTS